MSPTSNFCTDIIHEDWARIPTQLTRHSNIFTRVFLAPATRRLHATTPFSFLLPRPHPSDSYLPSLSPLNQRRFFCFPVTLFSSFFLFSLFLSFLSSLFFFFCLSFLSLNSVLFLSFLSFPFFLFFSFSFFLFFPFPSLFSLSFFPSLFFSSLFFPLFFSLSFFPSLFPSPFSLFPDGSAILPTISWQVGGGGVSHPPHPPPFGDAPGSHTIY